MVEGWEEKRGVLQLKLALECSGVSRREKIHPHFATGQCTACLRYSALLYIALLYLEISRCFKGRMVYSGT